MSIQNLFCLILSESVFWILEGLSSPRSFGVWLKERYLLKMAETQHLVFNSRLDPVGWKMWRVSQSNKVKWSGPCLTGGAYALWHILVFSEVISPPLQSLALWGSLLGGLSQPSVKNPRQAYMGVALCSPPHILWTAVHLTTPAHVICLQSSKCGLFYGAGICTCTCWL